MKSKRPSLHSDKPKPKPTRGLTKQSTSVLTSMVFHCAALTLLALMVFSESPPGSQALRLDGSVSEADDSGDLVSLEMPADAREQALATLEETPWADPKLLAEELQPKLDTLVDSRDVPNPPAPEDPLSSENLQKMIEMVGHSDHTPLTESPKPKNRRKSALELMTAVSTQGKSFNGPLLTDPKDGVRQTRTTAGAAGGILDQLREASKHDGPVWILWVMDASISLLEERRQLAPLVKNFYDELQEAKKPGAFPWPNTAVFAFGQGVVPLGVNKGRPQPLEIAQTLINVPIDESGKENVMTAVAAAVASVPFRNRDTRVEVVVWSDESGDDLNALEDVILLCQQRNARVHVVGPLSVLGMRKGLQQYTLPMPYNQAILLPVDRGPDSAFPERAQLPYWYESTDIDWGNGPIIPANLGPNNFGGPHRQRLLAPSGPYALTRLALATGGTFTAINRPGDLAAETREELFDYLPDYRSVFEIAYDIDRYPLRRAVIEAAALTGTVEYWPPRMTYPARQSDRFPYRTVGWYQTPQRFAKQLPYDLANSVERLRYAQSVIEQAIQIMLLRFNGDHYAGAASSEEETEWGLQEVLLEQVTPSEYHQEQSLRWKAWYDLNLGRLLAHSVRIREYILQCEILSDPKSRTMMVNQGFNQLRLTPSQEMKGGPVSATRVETAVQLLERVVREHADTPWGDLAAWELQHPVGVQPVLSVRPPPRPVKVTRPRQPEPPRPTLPRL